MKISNLKPQHQYSVIGQTLSLKSQIDYHNQEIKQFLNEMEYWEAKEYKEVYNDNIKRLNDNINYMKSEESHFNDELSTYGYTVTVFVAIYGSLLVA